MEWRHKARCFAHNFNTLDPNSGSHTEVADTRAKMLTDILGRVGSGTFIEPPFLPDYGCNIIMGENCFMNFKYGTVPPLPAVTHFPC